MTDSDIKYTEGEWTPAIANFASLLRVLKFLIYW